MLLHCQADGVQASRVRLERILPAIKRHVHGHYMGRVDQRDPAEVDERTGVSWERVLVDIDRERGEQEVGQHGEEHGERRDEIEQPAPLQNGRPLHLHGLLRLADHGLRSAHRE